jgi:hypothetical protein
MFSPIQIHHDRALVSRAALKMIILDRLPHKILEQMHTLDLTGKSDAKMIDIIWQAGRSAEKWFQAKRDLGHKKSISKLRTQPKPHYEKKPFKNRLQKDNSLDKPFQKSSDSKISIPEKLIQNKLLESIASELDLTNAAKECEWCGWPGDSKCADKMMDCYRHKRTETGTAPASFP